MGRYDRQLIELSDEEQERIFHAKVGLVGCGGLGTNVATALAVAGVRRFVIMDPDVPDETNLNRQYVYCSHFDSGDIRPKAEILAEWIKGLNPDAEVEYHVNRFDKNTCRIYDGCDVMVDCLDSIGSRMDLNEYCIGHGKPLVHGGVHAFIGQLTVCIPGRTPCLRCIMGNMPEPERPLPSIGSVVTSIGSMEATEVLKLITGRSGDSEGLFLSVDFQTLRVVPIRFERDLRCPVCGTLKG